MSVRRDIVADAARRAEEPALPRIDLAELGTPEERDAGWLIVSEAMAGGWRSVGPYGPRADLYDRP